MDEESSASVVWSMLVLDCLHDLPSYLPASPSLGESPAVAARSLQLMLLPPDPVLLAWEAYSKNM